MMPTIKTCRSNTCSLILAVTAFILILGVAFTSAAAENKKTKWVPGEPYPTELLDQYPCHSYELPCGQLPPPPIEEVQFDGPIDGDAKRGEKIAINLYLGNCIACHKMPGHDVGSGTIGPSLIDYASRSLPYSYTFQRIWDPRVLNPGAHMPVFGPNKILTKTDIVDVMAYIYSTD